ncbi:outer membrane protein [Stenotrophomonas maltophilia]|uniref:outer membrane protein n=1 Tax=Stenotrophomonas maltophilia TaxID=40324 RepID=UPI0034DAC81D
MQIVKNAATVLLIAAAVPQLASAQEGHYVAARVIDANHDARNMQASARPGIGQFVSGKNSNEFTTGAVAFGHAFGNQWRVEGEYTFARKETFTSGSSAFPTSFNHHEIRSQRLMANIYRDIDLGGNWSLYGTAGLGLARLESGGWQGNEGRRFTDASNTNLAWSLGMGVSYAPVERLALDLGYRHADMGTAESSWNAFTNARGLQDEKMSLNLVSREIYLGARYTF